jgi:hypothetical protein
MAISGSLEKESETEIKIDLNRTTLAQFAEIQKNKDSPKKEALNSPRKETFNSPRKESVNSPRIEIPTDSSPIRIELNMNALSQFANIQKKESQKETTEASPPRKFSISSDSPRRDMSPKGDQASLAAKKELLNKSSPLSHSPVKDIPKQGLSIKERQAAMNSSKEREDKDKLTNDPKSSPIKKLAIPTALQGFNPLLASLGGNSSGRKKQEELQEHKSLESSEEITPDINNDNSVPSSELHQIVLPANRRATIQLPSNTSSLLSSSDSRSLESESSQDSESEISKIRTLNRSGSQLLGLVSYFNFNVEI